MAAVIGNREISLGVMGGTLITAACYSGGEVFGCSPYDAATTAYLKATYPSYWAQIRDYGFANPQLVPWINEDNDLIVSLVSVGKERWLNNGRGYVDTGLAGNAKIRVDIDLKFKTLASGSLLAFANGSSAANWFGQNSNQFTIGSGYFFGNASIRKHFVVTWNNGTQTCTDDEGHTFSRSGSTTSQHFYFCGDPSYMPTDLCTIRCKVMDYDTNEILRDYVPFVKSDNSVVWLNLANIERGVGDLYYPNIHTSGAFTIELTDTPT